jgi:signal transduction histidine kinase
VPVGRIFFEKKLVQLVLIKLLRNAIRFSNKGNKVNIKVWLYLDNLEISIEDFGCGID